MKKIMNYRFFIVLLFFVASTHYTQATRKGASAQRTPQQRKKSNDQQNRRYAMLSSADKARRLTRKRIIYAAKKTAPTNSLIQKSAENTDNTDNDKKILEGYYPRLLGKHGRDSDPNQPDPIVSISAQHTSSNLQLLPTIQPLVSGPSNPLQFPIVTAAAFLNHPPTTSATTALAPHTLSSQQSTFTTQPLVSSPTISSQKKLLQRLRPAVPRADSEKQNPSIKKAPKTLQQTLKERLEELRLQPNSNPETKRLIEALIEKNDAISAEKAAKKKAAGETIRPCKSNHQKSVSSKIDSSDEEIILFTAPTNPETSPLPLSTLKLPDPDNAAKSLSIPSKETNNSILGKRKLSDFHTSNQTTTSDQPIMNQTFILPVDFSEMPDDYPPFPTEPRTSAPTMCEENMKRLLKLLSPNIAKALRASNPS